MVDWAAAQRGTGITLAVVAWAVTRKYRPHVYLAAYTTWISVVDLWRGPTGISFLPLDRALVQSFSFFFLALAVHYFLDRSARLVLAAFAVVVLGLLAFPTMSKAASYRLYFAVYDTTTVLVWGIVVYAVLRRRDVRPNLAHLVLVLYAATDAVAICFPLLKWRIDEWRVVAVSQLVCVTASIVAHLVFLFRARTEPGRLGQHSQ